MKENNKNEKSGDSGTLRMLAQPPDIPTIPPSMLVPKYKYSQ